MHGLQVVPSMIRLYGGIRLRSANGDWLKNKVGESVSTFRYRVTRISYNQASIRCNS